MNFEEYVKSDFEIRNGQFQSRYASGNYRVQEFGWGEPKTEYLVISMGEYIGSDYRIKQDTYGDWYLMRGYTKLCALTHLGGENWYKN